MGGCSMSVAEETWDGSSPSLASSIPSATLSPLALPSSTGSRPCAISPNDRSKFRHSHGGNGAARAASRLVRSSLGLFRRLENRIIIIWTHKGEGTIHLGRELVEVVLDKADGLPLLESLGRGILGGGGGGTAQQRASVILPSTVPADAGDGRPLDSGAAPNFADRSLDSRVVPPDDAAALSAAPYRRRTASFMASKAGYTEVGSARSTVNMSVAVEDAAGIT